MPRTGRKPKPSNIHVLNGNPSQLTEKELEEREPVKPPGAPLHPPADLTALERECWDLHARDLRRLNLLTSLDVASYRFLCTSYAIALSAIDALRPVKADGTPDKRKKRFEVIIRGTEGQPVRSPALLVWRQAVLDYRAWCVEFGLTPSARVGLRPWAPAGKASEPDDEDDDSAFFGT